MLCIEPASLKVTGMARRFAVVDDKLYTVVLPKVAVLAPGVYVQYNEYL